MHRGLRAPQPILVRVLDFPSICPYDCPYECERVGGGNVTAASARMEFRVRQDLKARIERAAELTHEQVSEFARSAAEEKADRIIRDHEITTIVPASFFDDLFDALDAPAHPNAALARAGQRAHKLVTRD